MAQVPVAPYFYNPHFAKKNMTGLEICFELKKRGWTQIRIARALGVTQSAVHQVVFNRIRSRKIRAFIAAVLNQEVKSIWADPESKSLT
jgi:lambda repressor-like predicted transcriptional regulator